MEIETDIAKPYSSPDPPEGEGWELHSVEEYQRDIRQHRGKKEVEVRKYLYVFVKDQ